MLRRYLENEPLTEGVQLETHGPLGTLWVGLGLGAFYTALIWVNLLLGHMLTPLFLLPLTWLQDAMANRKGERQVAVRQGAERQGVVRKAK